MMNKIVLRSHEKTYFDRQKLIPWWNQETISNARVMVVGAGALGNETIKNLVLLGFKRLFICDFDNIEISNLSRTVLFNAADIGKSKAHTAALRAKQLSFDENHEIRAFHGDITSDLGFGCFRNVDIVLACVDNVEARRFINRACRLVGTTWIDAGINCLAGHVSLFTSNSPACYECVLTEHQMRMSETRYSCGIRDALLQQPIVPTVQVTSSIISGLQTQECVKYLCGQSYSDNKRFVFDGTQLTIEAFTLKPRSDCTMHVSLGTISELPLNNQIRVREFLLFLKENGLGPNPILGTLGMRQFLKAASCRICGRPIPIYQPLHTVTQAELICRGSHPEESAALAYVAIGNEIVTHFDLQTTEPGILDLTLAEVGIPPGDIVTARNGGGRCEIFQLIDDYVPSAA